MTRAQTTLTSEATRPRGPLDVLLARRHRERPVVRHDLAGPAGLRGSVSPEAYELSKRDGKVVLTT